MAWLVGGVFVLLKSVSPGEWEGCINATHIVVVVAVESVFDFIDNLPVSRDSHQRKKEDSLPYCMIEFSSYINEIVGRDSLSGTLGLSNTYILVEEEHVHPWRKHDVVLRKTSSIQEMAESWLEWRLPD